MKSIWTIVSILCLIAAAIFLVRDNFDTAFVLATLGAIAWFLNYRSQLRGTINEETGPTEDESVAFEDEGEDEE